MASAIKLRDLQVLGIPKGAYLVHETTDIGFIPADHISLLDKEGFQRYVGLLDAAVVKIQPGAYGTEIVLADVDPQLMSDLDQAAADTFR